MDDESIASSRELPEQQKTSTAALFEETQALTNKNLETLEFELAGC
jgi:hypothetical protein